MGDLLELDVPVTGVTYQSVMGLEHTSGSSRFRLTVLEPHGVGSRYVGRCRSHNFAHDGRTGLVLVDRALDQLLLVLGTTVTSALHSKDLVRDDMGVDLLSDDRGEINVVGRGGDVGVEGSTISRGLGPSFVHWTGRGRAQGEER